MISDKQASEALASAMRLLETTINRMDRTDQIEIYTNICEEFADRIMALQGYERIEPNKQN